MTHSKHYMCFTGLCLALLILTGCSYAGLPRMFSATTPGSPAAPAAATAPVTQGGAAGAAAGGAIEAYFRALVSKNRAKYTRLICADWQANAAVEFDSFGAVTTSLDGLKCDKSTVQADSASVVCQGKIIVNYNGRLRDLTLNKRTYQARLENGAWKMCGYQ